MTRPDDDRTKSEKCLKLKILVVLEKGGFFFEILTSKINLKISKEESSCSHLHEGLAILIMGEFLVFYSWGVFIRYVLIADHSFTSSVIIPRPDKALPQMIIWPMPKVI